MQGSEAREETIAPSTPPADVLSPSHRPASLSGSPIDPLVIRVQEVVDRSVRPFAPRNDREARFPSEGVEALRRSGVLGLIIPVAEGGLGEGPEAYSRITALLAETDPSLAMIYQMHICATACILQAPRTPPLAEALSAIARGEHLTTLAFSERGSRSHFWAPVSRAVTTGEGVRISAEKSYVTGAGHVDSYVINTLSADGKTPVETSVYLVDARTSGLKVGPPWDGLGLRGNASSPLSVNEVPVPSERALCPEGKGLDLKLATVLPLFNLGIASVALGNCRAAVGATVQHLRAARLEHLGQTLGEAYPTQRARLAGMQIDTEGLRTRVDDLVRELLSPTPATPLRVLEAKAAADETSLRVTGEAMRACGGAAFSRALPVERMFRDAQASTVMAPTQDQLKEFIGRALLGLPLL